MDGAGAEGGGQFDEVAECRRPGAWRGGEGRRLPARPIVCAGLGSVWAWSALRLSAERSRLAVAGGCVERERRGRRRRLSLGAGRLQQAGEATGGAAAR